MAPCCYISNSTLLVSLGWWDSRSIDSRRVQQQSRDDILVFQWYPVDGVPGLGSDWRVLQQPPVVCQLLRQPVYLHLRRCLLQVFNFGTVLTQILAEKCLLSSRDFMKNNKSNQFSPPPSMSLGLNQSSDLDPVWTFVYPNEYKLIKGFWNFQYYCFKHYNFFKQHFWSIDRRCEVS